MSSNLPPGVTEGMLPGNRPEDIEWDEMCEWACDHLFDSNLQPIECRRAVLMGIAAVKAEMELINKQNEAWLAEEKFAWEMERREKEEKRQPICSHCGTRPGTVRICSNCCGNLPMDMDKNGNPI